MNFIDLPQSTPAESSAPAQDELRFELEVTSSDTRFILKQVPQTSEQVLDSTQISFAKEVSTEALCSDPDLPSLLPNHSTSQSGATGAFPFSSQNKVEWKEYTDQIHPSDNDCFEMIDSAHDLEQEIALAKKLEDAKRALAPEDRPNVLSHFMSPLCFIESQKNSDLAGTQEDESVSLEQLRNLICKEKIPFVQFSEESEGSGQCGDSESLAHFF